MKYLVLAVALISAVATSVKGAEIKCEDGTVIKVEDKQKKSFPSPRTYTKYIGKIDGDSVFVTKNGKYCKIKTSPKTGREYPEWLRAK